MDPVPGTVDALDPGPREQPPDAGFVLGQDVVGAGAGDEQCRSPVSSDRREIRKADDLRETALDRLQVQAPTGAVFVDHQILRQKSTFGGVGNGPGERDINLGAPRDAAEIDRPHGADIGEQVWRIGSRGDIDDDQPIDLARMKQGHQHCDLAAHAVPQKRGALDIAGAQRGSQILRHFAVGHSIGPGRGAVIAQIEGQNPVAGCEVLGNRPAIAAGTE